MTPAFDVPVPQGGYAWWYLDALSDDGQHGLTLIAFVGSVFSPYYARARRNNHGLADPLDHCALNVALYAGAEAASPTGWCMTERGRSSVERLPNQLRIGPSALAWDGKALTAQIDEVTVPWPRRLRGSIRLEPDALLDHSYPLDDAGRHHWCPIAPCARVEVALERPALHWRGSAVLYDVTRNDGSPLSLALAFDAQGRVNDFAPPPESRLPASGWRVPRTTRSDSAGTTRVAQTLEDGPFYARSVLTTRLLGETATAVHESLCLQRWARPAVQMMLPFRMPRRA